MRKVLIVCLGAALAGGCVFFPSAKDRELRRSPSFREGYSDGCAAATTPSSNYREEPHRDETLYQSDKAYRAGWANGFQTCRPTGQGMGAPPGANTVPQPVPGY